MPLLGATGGGSAKGFGALANLGYFIRNSLRIRGIDASAYLNRTPASAGNRRTWTYSAWIKRGNITPAAGGQSIFYAGSSTSTPRGGIVFGNSGSDNKLSFNGMLYNSATSVLSLETSAEFRDPSAWYHIVVVLDTTQATSSNRAKIYVNGSQVTAFGTATYPSLNEELQYNDAILHATRHPSADYEYDGYLAEVNFIDGQALTPSSFGKTDTGTGQWVPKKFAGTYGTNGFYLKFADASAATAAAIGKDSSPNGNNWTPNNISVTAGVTYDAMIDSPTLTSATVGNYCVLNPLIPITTTTIINGNLGLSSYNPSGSVFGTIGVSSGKWYFESISQSDAMSGISGTINGGVFPGAAANAYTWDAKNAQKISNSSGVSYGSAASNGDIIGVAFDLDSGSITFYKNNVSQGVAYTFTPSGTYFPVFRNGDPAGSPPGGNISVNFGQRPFSYTPPTGHKALNTFNLP